MFVGADTVEHIVLPGDALLLCSDGLHGAISAADMAEIVNRNSDLNVAARQLIDAANERDGGDNVSVQLIRVRSVERIGMYRGRPYKLA
jgi:protein phosphatase